MVCDGLNVLLLLVGARDGIGLDILPMRFRGAVMKLGGTTKFSSVDSFVYRKTPAIVAAAARIEAAGERSMNQVSPDTALLLGYEFSLMSDPPSKVRIEAGA